MFLDLDGTLLDLAERPEDVTFDTATQQLLSAASSRLAGRLAIVSGRSLAQIDEILGPVAQDIAISASHGCEHRWNGVCEQPDRPDSLVVVADEFRTLASCWPGTIVEEKSFGVALHFRMAPTAQAAAIALAKSLAEKFALRLQHGKMVVELRVGGGDKGSAVHKLMRRVPMAHTLPVFAGDDLTDEPGFAAARELGGSAILVGEPRATIANYGLPSPAGLRRWLRNAVL